MPVEKTVFGQLGNGTEIYKYGLKNKQGLAVELMELGASIISIRTPDKNGNFDDIVLGFSDPQAYLDNGGYHGSVVGRYANRIAGGRFTLDGTSYQLDTNNGSNHLHGGIEGFDKRIWQSRAFKASDNVGVMFTLRSPDGDQGYPGTLDVKVQYALDNANRLSISYEARTDRPTIVNLTQHAYFNLEGHGSGDILDQVLQINAEKFIPIRETSLPRGDRADVVGTPLDFQTPKPIGRDISNDDEQLNLGNGYDHSFVLANAGLTLEQPTLAARVTTKRSGRTMSVYTDKPGVQLYTGNFLKPGENTKDGVSYQKRQGFCLETQFFPDSPNQPQFPSPRLNPGDVYKFKTVFEFGLIE